VAGRAMTIVVVFAIAGCASEGAKRYWTGVTDEWREESSTYDADALWLWDPHRRDPSQDLARDSSQSRCDDDD